jgi:methionine biosynthesis protein MetW
MMRFDLAIIASWITSGSRVLDLGCGQGELLEHLHESKQVQAYGVEQDAEKAAQGIAHGVTIQQGDINEEVKDYPDNSFDFVVLSQTLQQVSNPLSIIREMLRVGRRGIVSFPNFAHWRNRVQVGFQGQTPVTRELPYDWHDTPNIRLITIKDFTRFCLRYGFNIYDSVPIRSYYKENTGTVVSRFPNLRATYGIFLLGRDHE